MQAAGAHPRARRARARSRIGLGAGSIWILDLMQHMPLLKCSMLSSECLKCAMDPRGSIISMRHVSRQVESVLALMSLAVSAYSYSYIQRMGVVKLVSLVRILL